MRDVAWRLVVVVVAVAVGQTRIRRRKVDMIVFGGPGPSAGFLPYRVRAAVAVVVPTEHSALGTVRWRAAALAALELLLQMIRKKAKGFQAGDCDLAYGAARPRPASAPRAPPATGRDGTVGGALRHSLGSAHLQHAARTARAWSSGCFLIFIPVFESKLSGRLRGEE